MLKIVHLCLSSFFIDGYSYQENLLPKYHAKLGYDVTVIASLVSFDEHGKYCLLDGPSVHEENGYKVIRISYSRKGISKINRQLRYYDGLKEQLRKECPDIIFSHGLAFSDISIVIDYVKAHPNVLLFGDNHADYYNSATNWLSKNILHKMIWKRVIKKAEPWVRKCFGVTPWRCDFMKEMYSFDSSKIDFLPMGVDDEEIPEDCNLIREKINDEIGLRSGDFLIVTGGKIDKTKNIHHLIHAIEGINDNRIKLLVFGNVSKSFESEMNPLLKSPFVHFMGWSSAQQVMDYLSAADLCCFPGTHSTLWEQSVGIGKPCVFNDWGCGMHHVNINGNCIFVQGDNTVELMEMIRGLIFTPRFDEISMLAQKASYSFRYSEIAKKAIEYSTLC